MNKTKGGALARHHAISSYVSLAKTALSITSQLKSGAASRGVRRRTAPRLCQHAATMPAAGRWSQHSPCSPLVYIQQHDRPIAKPFDAAGVVTSFVNPHIHMIKLHHRRNSNMRCQNYTLVDISEEKYNALKGVNVNGHGSRLCFVSNIRPYRGWSSVPLSQATGYDDAPHFGRTEWFKRVVLPATRCRTAVGCAHTPYMLFPERHVLYQMHADLDHLMGPYGEMPTLFHMKYGTYLYGTLKDGEYTTHRDSRRSGSQVYPRPFSEPWEANHTCLLRAARNLPVSGCGGR